MFTTAIADNEKTAQRREVDNVNPSRQRWETLKLRPPKLRSKEDGEVSTLGLLVARQVFS